MAIQYGKTVVKFIDMVSVEDTETLWQWMQQHPGGKINLAKCQHLHTSILQLLVLAKPTISAWPQDVVFKNVLQMCLAAPVSDATSAAAADASTAAVTQPENDAHAGNWH